MWLFVAYCYQRFILAAKQENMPVPQSGSISVYVRQDFRRDNILIISYYCDTLLLLTDFRLLENENTCTKTQQICFQLLAAENRRNSKRSICPTRLRTQKLSVIAIHIVAVGFGYMLMASKNLNIKRYLIK